MPQYDISDPRTGRQLTIEGDSEPTESELEQIFASEGQPNDELAASFSFQPQAGRLPAGLFPDLNYSPGLDVAPPGDVIGIPRSREGTAAVPLPEQVTKALSVTPRTMADARDTAMAMDEWMKRKLGVGTSLKSPEEILMQNRQPTTEEQVMSGVQNLGAGVAGTFADPLNAAAMVAGVGAPEVAARVIPAAFALPMITHAGEAGREAGRASVEGTPFEKTMAYGNLGINTFLAPFLARETVRNIAPITGGDFSRLAANELARTVGEPITPQVTIEQGTEAARPGIRRLGIPTPTTEPFLQPGVQDLAGAALAEAQNPIITPQKPEALRALRAAINPPQVTPEAIALAERIAGGGEAPYGKTSFMREAEAPLPERTQEQIQKEKEANALVPENSQFYGSLREKSRQGTPEVPPEENRPPTDEGGGGVPVEPKTKGPVGPTLAGLMESVPKEIATQISELRALWPDLPEGMARRMILGEPFSDRMQARFDALPEAQRKQIDEWFNKTDKTAGELIGRYEITRVTGRIVDAAKDSDEALAAELVLALRDSSDAVRPRFTEIFTAAAKEAEKRGSSSQSLQKAVQSELTKVFGADASEMAEHYFGARRPGGGESTLTPEQAATSRANNGRKAFAEAMGVPHIEGESNADFLKRVGEKKAESAPAETPVEEAAKGLISSIAQKGIENIESLQSKIRKGAQSGDTLMGVPSAILDTALEAARLALKAGKTVAEAVEAAMGHIRRNIKKGEYDEGKVRGMLQAELEAPKKVASPVGKDSAVGKGEQKESLAPKDKGAGLEDVYKIFEPAPKPETSVIQKAKQKGIDIIEAVRTGISSKFRPLNKLAEDIGKSYGRTSKKDIAGIFEQLKGSQGKGEADIYRFDQDVSKLVKGSEKDFNAYMFLRRSLDRLTQDQKDIQAALEGKEVKTLNRRRVSDYTLNSLNAKLDTLTKQVGPETMDKFSKAADLYQQHMDNALRLQVESGRMSPKVYEAIKKGNQFYAPFKVMKYLEETSKPEGSGGKPIDTVADFTKAMEGIEDKDFRLGDMLGAARQNILLSRILADKNQAMRSLAELSAFDTDGNFIKRLKPNEQVPSGMDTVSVMENGKPTKFSVNKDVAEAVSQFGGVGSGIIMRTLGKLGTVFRAGATTFNIPFQVSNLMADVPRQALVSKYGINAPADLVRYPLDFVHALYSSMAGDVFGARNKLFMDFLDSGVAGTTVQEHLTPEALKFKEPTTMSRSAKLARTVLNTIPEFAQAIEQTSKVLGVKRAMRFEGVKSGAELAKQIPDAITELRRFSGSPDFGRQGSWVEQSRLNLLYMFLNARIQGAVADVGRLTGRDGAGMGTKTWAKLLTAVGIPTAYLYYINNRPENKADYDKRSAQEKQNYWLIPKDSYITTEDGQKMRDYWRIPKRESSKWIANLTESALNFADKKNPQAALDFGQQMVQEISPVNIQGENAQERLESVASGLNPVIKAPLELATGRDLYRHRDLMSDRLKKASPEEQYTDRTAEAFKKLAVSMPDVAPEMMRSPIILENLTRNLTAGLFTQFLKRKPVEGRKDWEQNPLLQRFQALPYEDNAAFKEELQKLEREAADEQLNRHRAATKLLEDNRGKPLNVIVDKVQDPKLLKHIADLWVAEQNGATMKDRQLLSLPAKQRGAYVKHQLEGKTPAEKAAMIQDFARKRILTEAVVQEMGSLE